MPTIYVLRSDVTSDEVVKVLRDGLGSRYDVLPGLQLSVSSFFAPAKQAQPDEIVVSLGNSVLRAQVSIARQAEGTAIQVRPGGLLSIWLINEFGVARRVRQVLRSAPSLTAQATVA